jgi:hypothetical protein
MQASRHAGLSMRPLSPKCQAWAAQCVVDAPKYHPSAPSIPIRLNMDLTPYDLYVILCMDGLGC